MKKISQQQEGTLFLFIVCSGIWVYISIYNENDLLLSIIGGICLGALSTLVLGILFSFMKAVFKW